MLWATDFQLQLSLKITWVSFKKNQILGTLIKTSKSESLSGGPRLNFLKGPLGDSGISNLETAARGHMELIRHRPCSHVLDSTIFEKMCKCR